MRAIDLKLDYFTMYACRPVLGERSSPNPESTSARRSVAYTAGISATAEIGRYVVHVNANDLATMGAQPRWLLLTLLLPERASSRALVEAIMAAIERGVNDCIYRNDPVAWRWTYWAVLKRSLPSKNISKTQPGRLSRPKLLIASVSLSVLQLGALWA